MISGRRSGNLGASLRTKTFEIVSGVPEKLGGENEGPDPHEILEAALAACTIITVQMYANRKQWPLTSTDVEVRIVSEKPEGSEISLAIDFKGNLTAEQRERLLEIAGKCPIHKMLTAPIKISTTTRS